MWLGKIRHNLFPEGCHSVLTTRLDTSIDNLAVGNVKLYFVTLRLVLAPKIESSQFSQGAFFAEGDVVSLDMLEVDLVFGKWGDATTELWELEM